MSTGERKRARIRVRRRYLRSRARRVREMLTTALLIMFILATGILLLKITAMRADAEKRNIPVYKYYTTVEVCPGDTLWSIAGSYSDAGYGDICTYVDEITDINHLHGDYLTPGEKLCIPYYSTEQR